MKTTEQLQAQLDALLQLKSGWNRLGEIEEAKRAIRDSGLPIYDSRNLWGTEQARRIVSVDAKWIVLRDDVRDEDDVTRYKRETGWRERARNEWGAIDPAKALAIWEAHQKETQQTPK